VKAENAEFLDRNRFHYDCLVKAQYVKHLDGATIDGLVRIVREEFDSGYLINTWCGDCVMNMLKFVYEQYDKINPKVDTKG
jgi:hypothetical protein